MHLISFGSISHFVVLFKKNMMLNFESYLKFLLETGGL